MSKPKRGEVWLVRFPFTDLTSTKLRPALVWAVHGEDKVRELTTGYNDASAGSAEESSFHLVNIDDQTLDFGH